MAVKVMLAPAIAQRAKAMDREPGTSEPKPKRRASSVYDRDGNEVFLTLMCLKCHQLRPLSQFGLRRMADGAIRNQPWCRSCRSGASGKDPSRQKRREPEASPAEHGLDDAKDARSTEVVDAGRIAALVVAALNGGRR